MPIDPSINLQVQQNDPMASVGKVLSLKSLMQQQRIQGQQLEQNQRSLDDDTAARKLLVETGGDWEKAAQTAASRGLSPAVVEKLQKAAIERKTAIANMTSAQLEQMKKTNEFLGTAANWLLQVPPDQRPDAYKKFVAISGEKQKELGIQLPMDAPLDDDTLKVFVAQSQSPEKQNEEAFKAKTRPNEVRKGVAEADRAEAEAMKSENEAMAGPAGPYAEAKYRFILQKKAAGKTLTPDDIAYVNAFEASNAKTSTQSDSLGVTSSTTTRPTGMSSVKTVPAQAGVPNANAPAAPIGSPNPVPGAAPTPSFQGQPHSPENLKSTIVDMVGQYKYDPAQLNRLMVKHPDLIARIQQKYPDFNQMNYQAANKMVQSYTSGPTSREINAINTAMGHLGELNEAIDALKNGNVQVLNKIAQSLGAQTGNTAATTFKTIVHRVGPEITAAYVSGGGGEAERLANAEDFSPNLSPDQLKKNIGVSIKLARSKVSSLENQWKNTIGRDDFKTRFITPQAQKALDAAGGEGGSGAHVIQIGNKRYQYKGTGKTDDLANYTELK